MILKDFCLFSRIHFLYFFLINLKNISFFLNFFIDFNLVKIKCEKPKEY